MPPREENPRKVPSLAHQHLFQALERRLEHLAQVFRVAPHGLLLAGIGPLARLQDHSGGIGPLRHEGDPEDGFTGEPGGGPPAQALRFVTPLEKAPRFECCDQLVDL